MVVCVVNFKSKFADIDLQSGSAAMQVLSIYVKISRI
jgi:hypothetical protein